MIGINRITDLVYDINSKSGLIIKMCVQSGAWNKELR